MGTGANERLRLRPAGRSRLGNRLRGCAGRCALLSVFVLAACTTAPPPVEPVVQKPTPLPPIIIVQPIRPEPPPPVAPPAPEPQKVNEEAEEALAVLVDLQKL